MVQHRPTRRDVLRMAAVGGAAALTGGLAGCGGSGSGSGGRTLSFIYLGASDTQPVWEQLFGRFREKHPEIRLEAEAIGDGSWASFFNKVAIRIAGGQSPDLIQVATEGQRLFASKGLLTPLDDFIAQDQEEIDAYLADIDPNLREWNQTYASPGGKTYYLPGDFNTMLMHCNEKVFEAAGLEVPDGSWDWEEFRSVCEQIKDRTGAVPYAAEPSYFVGIMPWLLTAGGSSYNASWSKPTMDSEPARAAAAFNAELVAAGLAPPPGGTFDAITSFSRDEVAMFGGGRWPVSLLRNLEAVDKTVLVPFPSRERQGSPVGWNSYPILADSQNKQDAWTFIKFLISQEGSAYFASLGGTIVPARQSIAQGRDFLADSPRGSELLFDALSFSTPIPSPDEGPSAQIIIEDTWQQMLTGNMSPRDGMDEAQSQLEALV